MTQTDPVQYKSEQTKRLENPSSYWIENGAWPREYDEVKELTRRLDAIEAAQQKPNLTAEHYLKLMKSATAESPPSHSRLEEIHQPSPEGWNEQDGDQTRTPTRESYDDPSGERQFRVGDEVECRANLGVLAKPGDELIVNGVSDDGMWLQFGEDATAWKAHARNFKRTAVYEHSIPAPSIPNTLRKKCERAAQYWYANHVLAHSAQGEDLRDLADALESIAQEYANELREENERLRKERDDRARIDTEILQELPVLRAKVLELVSARDAAEADVKAEQDGGIAMRGLMGARSHETLFVCAERLTAERDAAVERCKKAVEMLTRIVEAPTDGKPPNASFRAVEYREAARAILKELEAK